MTEKSMQEKIVVLDFGGQYNQLIARRVRDGGVYAEIYPYAKPRETWLDESVKGVILTGGPSSVYLPGAPGADVDLFSLGVPVLGICYGMQLLAHKAGGTVEHADVSEYGHTVLHARGGALFAGVSPQTVVFMNHTDRVTALPEGFSIDASTDNCPIAAYSCPSRGLYGVQFHPEVRHSVEGDRVLNNFVYGVCGCQGGYRADDLIDRMIERVRAQVGEGTVVAGLSGGVDSSVACVLASRALKKEQLTCVFVDHGLLRKNEGDEVEAVFGPNGPYQLNFIRVNAQQRFYDKLKGVEDPERKRKIIGEEFIRVFEEEAKKIGAVDYLVQGTIYPDVVESGLGGESAVIKSHHNVGGLPDCVDFKEIIEPLRDLFKDEVRKAGLQLGIPDYLVFRQPFPGPGLGIRIIGEVTAEKVQMVQDADAIWREEIAKAGWDKKVNQYFAALTNMRSVGVMGDERTYDYAIALRAVTTTDFMTAESAEIPWEVIGKTTSRIVNEVKHVNRVMYDCTGKPPATIEFE